MPITHSDGATYYSQAEIEAAIKDRLKAKETEIAQRDAALKDAEKRLGEFEPLRTQAQQTAALLEKAQAEAAAATGALTRYRAAGTLGIADPDTIDALEFAHTRAMASVEEGKRVPFDAYLTQIKTDPTLAPSYLRPVLSGIGQQTAQATTQAATQGQAGGQQATAGAAGQGGATGQQAATQGAQAGQQAARPVWAPAVAGQRQVDPGARQDFSARVAAANTLEDIAKLAAEKRARG